MLFNTIDWSKLDIPKLAKSEKQVGYYASVPTIKNSSVNIQAPLGLFPFGTSPPNPEKSIKKWSVSLAKMDNGATKPIMEKFFDKMGELDEHLINYAHAHSVEFFGKQLSLEVVRDKYNPSIKIDDNPENAAKYGPRISPAVGFNDDTKKFDEIPCKNVDGTDLPIDKVPRKSKGILQFRLGQVYCVNQKAFGVTLFVTRVDLFMLPQAQAKAPVTDAYDDPEMTAALLAIKIPEPSTKPLTEGAPPNLAAYDEDGVADGEKKRGRDETAAAAPPAAEQKKSKGKGKK